MALVKQNKADKKDGKDPWIEFYTQLRKKGPECRDGVLQDTRWDFFRGKDFLSYMRENMHLIDPLPLKAKGSNSKPDDVIESLANHMIRTGVIFRADRAVKTPKPGKKLLKFPKRLEMHQDNCFVEDGFYVWRFVLPDSVWTYLGSAGLVVVTIGCCLFPLAPHWVKKTVSIFQGWCAQLGVLYTCLTLLCLIFIISVVRAMIFGAVWVLFGKHLWVLPNLFSDDVGITEALVPWYEFEEDAAKKAGQEMPKPPSLLSRLLAAAATACTLYCLYTYSPETDEMRAMARTSHKSILEMLDLYEVPKQIGGNVTNTTDISNATDSASPESQEEFVDPASSASAPADDVDDEALEDEDSHIDRLLDGLEPEEEDDTKEEA